jgi:hypothetical protein
VRMRVARLRSTIVVAAVAVAVGIAVGCGGSAARVQADASTATAVTSTTIDDALVCAQKVTQYEQEYATLDEYRVTLGQEAQTLEAKVNAAVASNSPDAGKLQAQYSAVLRLLSDTQQRILSLENSNPDSHPCASSETCSGDSMSSTTVCKSSP